MHSDLEVAVCAFLGVMAGEALVKPIALHVGRWIIRRLDRYVGVIPDWLHNGRA